MIVDITIRREDGTVVAEVLRNAMEPFTWKLNPENPERETNLFGEIRFFGFTFQPHVMLMGKAGGF
jgi:hypothetical protein